MKYGTNRSQYTWHSGALLIKAFVATAYYFLIESY